jgi:hypothetical protein
MCRTRIDIGFCRASAPNAAGFVEPWRAAGKAPARRVLSHDRISSRLRSSIILYRVGRTLAGFFPVVRG